MPTDVEIVEKLEQPAAPAPPSISAEKPPEAPPVAEPAKEPGAAPVVPEEKPAEGEPTEPEAEPDLDQPAEASGDFEKFKPVFESHPELKTELKQIIGREKAYSELGTFSEVRGIVERIPTLEDAETLATQAENARNFGDSFRSDPETFVESLKESDPLAFRQLAERLPEVLAETDPAAYTAQSRYYMTATLDYLFRAGQGNEEFIKALGTVAGAMGINLGVPRATSHVDPEKQKLKQQLEERTRADEDAAVESFWTQTDSVIVDTSVDEIAKAVKQAVPTASENQIKRMVKEAHQQMLDVIASQPQTLAQIERFKEQARSGRRGLAEHKAIINYALGRARLIIPKVVRSVVSEWTKEVLRTNNTTVDKKKAVAAATRDAGAGAQGTSGAMAPAAPSGKRRTEEDVFRELESRTYVPRH